MKGQIDEIIKIDEKTQILVKETEEKIEELREDFRKKATDMENKAIEDAKITAQEEFDKIINQSKAEAEKKERENREKLKKVDLLYEKNKKYLIDKVFNEFILNKDGNNE
ncbi:hypothetical protein [Anaerosphaera multitolerans]|uniref:ATPase n=1 Tax=Anaerosphaera multitolerans TaxID=2487351 RepID=A0A437S9X2_9FIRM|nr:hypothetical protein [Anaerosphaera multitolerans]RVU55681.1 hypothetical protein EF514_00250 [Anaerosphaera multitolerans]